MSRTSYDLGAMSHGRRDPDRRLAQLVEEHAAWRRLATLVARGVTSEELFSAVSTEVGKLFGADAVIARVEPDGTAMVVVGLTDGIPVVTIGTRWEPGDFLASTAVCQTGRAAASPHNRRQHAPGAIGDALRETGVISSISAPIVVQGTTWGVIAVAETRKALPQDADERLKRFTELVAIAIANNQAREHLGQLAAEQAALRRVATLVARGVSEDELFSKVNDEVGGLFDSEASIAQFEPDGSGILIVAQTAGIPIVSIGTRWELDDLLATTRVYRTGRPARNDWTGLETAAGPTAERLRRMNFTSTVAAPIVVEGGLWGVVTVSHPTERLPPDTEERVERFAELVATAIADAESRAGLAASEARAHELAREQAALRRIATLVAESTRADELFAAVAQELADVLDIPVVGVQRFETDRTFTMMGIAGETNFTVGSRWPVEEEGLAGMILATGRPARKEDYAGMPGPLGAAVRDDRMVATVGVPIIVEGGTWGFMVAATRPGKPFPSDVETQLNRFTELVATAIANAESRAELAASEARARYLAKEQTALRRVATLVAHAANPDEVFSAVAEEVARVFDVELVTICRYEVNTMLVLSCAGDHPFTAGSRWPLDVPSLPASIYRTTQPSRIDDFSNTAGLDAAARDAGVTAAIGVPIIVGGTAWGSINIAWKKNAPFDPDAETRLTRFTDLVATSVSNAIIRNELAASRARVITASDDARRRIERNLHDGAQQQLVTLTVALRRAEAKIPTGSTELRADLARVAEGLTTAIEQLRELSQGIHPSILTEGGLSPALKVLGRRSPIRVKLDIGLERRLPDHVEVAAYYTVSEALTNASKHATATRTWVSLHTEDDVLHLSIRDDGVGGADTSLGSGLTGLRDRIEALGGHIQIESPPGRGTVIEVAIPIAT
jgi:signal transduction histidine kinase